MSEQRQAHAEQAQPADHVERPLPADELRRRQQLGQTPGMFVEPTAGQAADPNTDEGGEPDKAA